MESNYTNNSRAKKQKMTMVNVASWTGLISLTMLSGFLAFAVEPKLGPSAYFIYSLLATTLCSLSFILVSGQRQESPTHEPTQSPIALLPARIHSDLNERKNQQVILQLIPRLRRPLNGIMASLQLRGADDSLEPEMAEIVDYCSHMIVRHLEDAQLMAEIESGHIEYENTNLNLEAFIKEIIDPIIRDSEKGIAFELEVDKDTPKYLQSFAEPLAIILSNLVDNAERFTESGLIKVTVEGGTSTKSPLKISVRDTGIGMNSRQIENALKGAVVASLDSGDLYDASGVGFSIIQTILNQVNGNLWIESEPGFGTLVGFTVPGVPGLAPSTSQEQDPKVASMAAQSASRILLVDDETFARTVSKRGLENLGYICDQATSGAEAILMVAENQYSLILMDINMPEMDGWQTTKEIISMLPEENLPFIMALTSHTQAQDRRRSEEIGMDGFLSKPVDFKKLEQKLKSLGLNPKPVVSQVKTG